MQNDFCIRKLLAEQWALEEIGLLKYNFLKSQRNMREFPIFNPTEKFYKVAKNE